ncbi:MAG: hypothetical protein WKF58_05375 [Ilumatobacteraceae bacterium]
MYEARPFHGPPKQRQRRPPRRPAMKFRHILAAAATVTMAAGAPPAR